MVATSKIRVMRREGLETNGATEKFDSSARRL